ncbi:hypothetical protein D3C83_103170 [compost metagenome]
MKPGRDHRHEVEALEALFQRRKAAGLLGVREPAIAQFDGTGAELGCEGEKSVEADTPGICARRADGLDT